MPEVFGKWDMADDIRDAEDVVAYLNAWLEDCDASELAYLLDCIVRSEGMADLVRRAGLNGTRPCDVLDDSGNSSLDVPGCRLRIECGEEPYG